MLTGGNFFPTFRNSFLPPFSGNSKKTNLYWKLGVKLEVTSSLVEWYLRSIWAKRPCLLMSCWVLFNDDVSWWGYTASVIDEWTMWSAGRIMLKGGTEKLWQKRAQCQVLHHKCHVKQSGTDAERSPSEASHCGIPALTFQMAVRCLSNISIFLPYL